MKQNLEIYYDVEDDRLEIQIGEPTKCYYDEISDDLFEGHDEKTDKLKGYVIFNFLKRGGMKGMKEIKIPLPANIDIKSIPKQDLEERKA